MWLVGVETLIALVAPCGLHIVGGHLGMRAASPRVMHGLVDLVSSLWVPATKPAVVLVFASGEGGQLSEGL